MFRLNKNSILLILCGIIFLTVFIQTDSLMNGYESAKRIFFYLAAGMLIAVASVQLILRKEKVSFRFSITDIAILVYFIYQLTRLLFTPYSYVFNDQFIILALCSAFYFVIRYVSPEKAHRTALFYLFLVTGLIQGCIALLQLYGVIPSNSQYFKVTGTFANPDAFAGFAASVLPFALAMYLLQCGDNKLRNIGLTTFLILILSLAATQIRGGWLAASAGCILIYISYKKHLFTKLTADRLKFSALIITTAVISIIIIFFLFNLRPDSAKGRILIWKISSGIFAEKPVFGIGYDRFSAEYNNYQSEYFANASGNDNEERLAGNVNRAHNEYLEILVESGICGLSLFIIILISIFLPNDPESSKQEVQITTAARASVLSIMIFSLTSFPLHILPTQINFYLLLGIVSSQSKSIKTYALSGKLLKVISFFIIFCSMFLFTHAIKQYNCYKQWENAMRASFLGKYSSAERLFSVLEPSLGSNGEFLFNYGGMLSLSGKHEKAVIKLNKAKNIFSNTNLYISLGNSYAALGRYKDAEKSYLRSVNMVPHKLYQKYLLARLYLQSGEIGKSVRLAKKIISVKEKVKSQATAEIKTEMKTLIEQYDK